MLGLRVRYVCWIQAEPQLVREYFPEVFMEGTYGVTSARSAGLTQNGLLYIGTCRPRALKRALSDALPGRRLGAGSEAGGGVIEAARGARELGVGPGGRPGPSTVPGVRGLVAMVHEGRG